MTTCARAAAGLSVAVALLIAPTAWAQTTNGATAQPSTASSTTAAPAPAEEAAPAKRLTVTTGVDFTSAYLFRGIRQHSGGTIAQPLYDLGIALGHGVSANVGGWNSVHSTAAAGNWYESDVYGSVTFTAGKLKPGLLYTSYTSPADSFATVQELAGAAECRRRQCGQGRRRTATRRRPARPGGSRVRRHDHRVLPHHVGTVTEPPATALGTDQLTGRGARCPSASRPNASAPTSKPKSRSATS